MSFNQFLKDKVLTSKTLKILLLLAIGWIVLSRISSCLSSNESEIRTKTSSTTLIRDIKLFGNLKVLKFVDSDFASFYFDPSDMNSFSVTYQYKVSSELFFDLSKIQVEEKIENGARKTIVSLPALQAGEIRDAELQGERYVGYSSRAPWHAKKKHELESQIQRRVAELVEQKIMGEPYLSRGKKQAEKMLRMMLGDLPNLSFRWEK